MLPGMTDTAMSVMDVFQHALPLPFFILLSNDIVQHAEIFTASGEKSYVVCTVQCHVHVHCTCMAYLYTSTAFIHALACCIAEHLVVPLLGLGAPKMWLYLLGNVLTQYP